MADLQNFIYQPSRKATVWRRTLLRFFLSLCGQKEPQFQSTYKIEDEDVEIIASFLKSKIKMIYTSDRAFHETCKILGLDSKLITMNNYGEMKRRV